MTARLRTFASLAFAATTVVACSRHGPAAGPAAGGAPVTGTSAAPRGPAMPAGVTAAMITLGDSLYHANACARCHGRSGINGPNGPSLAKGDSVRWLHSSGTYEEIVATIIAGVPREKMVDQSRRFQMNPRGSNPPLSDEQVKAVAAYIWKLNHP